MNIKKVRYTKNKHGLSKKQKCELMGKKITIDKTFLVHREFYKRTITERVIGKPRKGWIVGFGFLKSGSIERDEEYIAFDVEKTYPCVIVAISTTGTTERVPVSVLDNYSI